MKIILERTSLGAWIGKVVGDIKSEPIRTLDREETLLTVLAQNGIEVVQRGEWYDFGVKKSWNISNMTKDSDNDQS